MDILKKIGKHVGYLLLGSILCLALLLVIFFVTLFLSLNIVGNILITIGYVLLFWTCGYFSIEVFVKETKWYKNKFNK